MAFARARAKSRSPSLDHSRNCRKNAIDPALAPDLCGAGMPRRRKLSRFCFYLQRHSNSISTAIIATRTPPRLRPWTAHSPGPIARPTNTRCYGSWPRRCVIKAAPIPRQATFAELIDAALIAWPDDARTALLGVCPSPTRNCSAPPTTMRLTTCQHSAGCRLLPGAVPLWDSGDPDCRGRHATAAGLDLCEGIRSIPCTALRASGDATDMAGST